jgi:NADPH:quinone reductase-like Zn-dependent oxidoreductase
VTRFRKGDAVFAYMSLKRGGAYAEYSIVGEDEVALKPSKLDHVQAAAVPLAALTAWQALHDTAGLTAGQTVLIHGAAGGVGSFAVQIAKAGGANVIGTASAGNQVFLKEIGADRTVDYRAQKFEEIVKDVDVVLDTVGGDTLERSFKVVRPGGYIVSIVDNPARFAPQGTSVRAKSILVKPDAAELAKIASMLDEGKIKPIVSEIVPLAEARRAQEKSEGGHTRGKIVLRVVD